MIASETASPPVKSASTRYPEEEPGPDHAVRRPLFPRLATAEKTCDYRRDAGRAVHQHQVAAALDDVKLGRGMSAAMIRWFTAARSGRRRRR